MGGLPGRIEEWGASGATSTALGEETLGTSYVYGDDLISQTKGTLSSFYHYDGLGTTRALSNSAATITDRYAYTAFGETDPAGTSGNNAGTTENNYLYAGEQKDQNLGFYYLRARYMDPRRGSFISQDSWMGNSSDPVTLHKYAYANLNPVMGVDPSGMFSLTEIGAAINIVSMSFASQTQADIDLINTYKNRYLWNL